MRHRRAFGLLALTAGLALATAAPALAQCKGADRAVEQKLALGPAPSETLVTLRIALCTRHEFKLVLESGQRVELSLASPSGQQGMVTLMAPSGTKPADGENAWSGAVTESGIYTLAVATDFSTSYSLKVSVR